MGDSRGDAYVPTHVPVLLERCGALLAPAWRAATAAGRRPVHVDATLGLGGHAEALLAAHPELTLIGVDRDPQALAHARHRLAAYRSRVEFAHAVYDQLPGTLAALGHPEVDGILFDLGVSSWQLDEPTRGFAYRYDAPLDMRMDPGQPRTAEAVVNTYPTDQLTRVLREYGEERFAARIARAVARRREHAPLRTTGELAEVIREALPAAAVHRATGHPAKRSFQALRIEVNAELTALATALPAALDLLAPGGRIVIISYHSLEDRIAKRVLRERAQPRVPADLPVVPPDAAPTIRLLTRGAERPDATEVAANPRAASARLRAAERLPVPASPTDEGV